MQGTVWTGRRSRAWAGLALLCGLQMLGCAQLPVIRPDPPPPSAAVRLEGLRGPMSHAQSRAVLAQLERNSPQTDIFSRHLAIEEAIVGSPLTTGNAVVLLQDGPATYRAMLAAIEAARDHIHLETYILDDDEVGQRFAEALITKQAQGVQVSILHDSFGTLGTPAAFFQKLTDNGIQVLAFNPLTPSVARKQWDLNQRNHRKLLVVDGRTAFLGGINISSVYSGGSFKKGSERRPEGATPWRDTHLQVRGPAVAELQRLFIDHWVQQGGAPLGSRQPYPAVERAGEVVVRAIGSSPEDPHSLIYATLLSAIASAETSVQLTNAYFVPDPQLLDALTQAAGRGVAVTLILPSQSDSWLALNAGRSHYGRLLRAGVKVHERRGVVLHAKTAVVDGVWATVGSTNLDWRSFLYNHELNAVVLGTAFGSQLQAMFAQDLAASDAITLDQWSRRPLHRRLLEQFANAWAPWL